MICTERTFALVLLHITILLWGITAILGKMISYGSLILVWHRMMLTFLVYLCIPSFWYQIRQLTWVQIKIFFGIGIIISIHWIFFYGSIKLGDSASITLTCAGSLGFFTSILEPMILKQPYSYVNIGVGLLAIVGIGLVSISFSMSTHLSDHKISSDIGFVSPQLAVASGVIATILASIFFVLNKKYIGNASPLVMSTIEMGAGAIFLTILVPTLYKDILWFPNFDPYNLR